MQGAVNGDSIGQLEILDCNATEFCVKLPSTGHVGRKLYEGAQYSCSYGECSKDGCFNSGIGEICCCSEDECNFTQTKNFLAFYVILFLFLAIFGRLAQLARSTVIPAVMTNFDIMEHKTGDNLIKASEEDFRLVYDSWPENFGCLFDMGLRAFERLFSYRPALKKYFSETDDDAWKKEDSIKKIVLSLEQTLAQAVGTYADPKPEESNTPVAFCEVLQEIGGLHRAIVQHIRPDNYELLFKLLPEAIIKTVIADVVSAKRPCGPFQGEERQRFLSVWTSMCNLMSRQFIIGWERRVVPKSGKLSKVYRERAVDGPKSAGKVAKPCSFASGETRRAHSTTDSSARMRDRPNFSRTQNEMKQWQLERGHSAPLQVTEIEVALDMISIQTTPP
ncbi:unnamed protein product [Caenorhabditis auriculariae]|uniref:Globin domain-containing protein n=1 Tax=Caenorhabditis auriculariae TaxID=2777116 RepID=A0A8S1GUD2_9PELO|nr:unnamed protein product [Caenorhabditis auriculariae]